MFYWRRDPYADTWVLRTLTKLSKFLIVYWEKWSSPRQFSWKDHVHFILLWSMIWASMHTMWLMYFEHVWSIGVAPMVSLRGKRETRVNGNDSHGTMGRPLSPSRPPLRANFHRERDIWVRGRGSTIARQKLPENSSPSVFWRFLEGTQKEEQNFLTKTCLGYIPSLLTRRFDLLRITLRPVSLLYTDTLQNKCSIALDIK